MAGWVLLGHGVMFGLGVVCGFGGLFLACFALGFVWLGSWFATLDVSWFWYVWFVCVSGASVVFGVEAGFCFGRVPFAFGWGGFGSEPESLILAQSERWRHA